MSSWMWNQIYNKNTPKTEQERELERLIKYTKNRPVERLQTNIHKGDK
jgi:hypothetical protein